MPKTPKLCYSCYFCEVIRKHGGSGYVIKCHRTGEVMSPSEAPKSIWECRLYEPVWNHRTFMCFEKYIKKAGWKT
ncbi:hypothetical protein DRO69_06220 [Candidatus Bathyarchaeota archaeon]|nr:MAG: hypothetical protein DRO69_06220 [Candidatus Bathyarchaeota archaeon]